MSIRLNNECMNVSDYVYFNTQSTYAQPVFTKKREKISNKIDKVVKQIDEEKEKKHNKTAIAVGTAVVSLSLLVALFNPRVSTKLIEKLKSFQFKTKKKFHKSKGDFLASKFYKFLSESSEKIGKFISYTNNANSVKDTYFKKFCTERGTNVKNRDNKFLSGLSSAIRKFLNKTHKNITEWGDSLAKHTVKTNYKSAEKNITKLEDSFKTFYNRLSPEEKKKFNNLLMNAQKEKAYFDFGNLETRFFNYEQMMKNLNSDVRKQWVHYRKGFANKYVKTSEHFNKNLSFWAQDIMSNKRGVVNKEGMDTVNKFFDGNDMKKGYYDQLMTLVRPHVKKDEIGRLEKVYKKAQHKLRKANKSECMDYFDKKRDFVLGSAPTDIVTALFGLSVGGTALLFSKDRDERISKLMTSIIPAAAGIGTNIALTSMLFSGTKGMLIGAAAGFTMSLIGNGVNKYRLRLKGVTQDAQNN